MKFPGATRPVIDFPDAFRTRVWAINNDGDIVGDYREGPGMFFQAFVRRQGEFLAMDVPCAVGSTPRDINGNGDIAGFLRDEKNVFWAFKVSSVENAVASDPELLEVVEFNTTSNDNYDLEPDASLVVSEGAAVNGNIEGDGSNAVVLAADASVNGNLEDVETLSIGGANAYVSGNFENDDGVLLIGAGASVSLDGNVSVGKIHIQEEGSVSISGNVHVTEELIMEARTSIEVDGNLECETTTTSEIDPTAAIGANGNIDCPVL